MKNIGTRFKLRVHSCRWGHDDSYFLTKSEESWLITYNKATDAPSDKGGNPILEKALWIKSHERKGSITIARLNSVKVFKRTSSPFASLKMELC